MIRKNVDKEEESELERERDYVKIGGNNSFENNPHFSVVHLEQEHRWVIHS